MKFKAKRAQAARSGGAPASDAYRFRDGHTCWWCGRRVSYRVDRNDPLRATREHVVPKSDGGGGTHANIVVACQQCNTNRGADTDWIPFSRLNAIDTEIPRRQWDLLKRIGCLPNRVAWKKEPI